MSPSETTASGWAVLMKFGSREHMEALRNQGELFLNTQSYFARREAGPERADSYEGSDRIYQPTAVKEITVEGPIDQAGTRQKIVIRPEDMAGPLSVRFSGAPRFNIYCLFGVRQPQESPLVDVRNFAFGDSFVLIRNTQQFLNRAAAAAKAAGFGSTWRFVEYYDVVSYSGDAGPFRKPSTHAHQNEFRFLTLPGLAEPLILRLGDLTDITTPVHTLSDINELVDFSPEAAKWAGL